MPLPPLKTNTEAINVFAETNFRNERKRFGIKLNDRRRHVYVIGKTGTGKTNLLRNMAINDILAGNGVGIVDPHGEFAEEVLAHVPKDRLNDVIYFNPADLDHPIAFNAIEQVNPEHRHLVASGLMGVFKKIWPDVWSARMEYILNNAILALLEYPDSTLLGIQRMLSDKNYRKQVVEQLSDPVVKAFWVQEFAKYTQRLETEAVASIQNKVGQFISTPVIRNIVGQTHSTIDPRRIMDEGKILIVNLSKGLVGEDNSKLLGGLIVTKLQLAAMSRVDIPREEDRRDFFLYVDEFQNFATASFASILSEARKYRLSLILANQYVMQLDETVADAVFGNVGTIITFRIGAEDAETLEKEFEPEFAATDLVNLPNFHIYIKLMIDGVTSRAFSATVLPPYPKPVEEFREEIIRISRERYSTRRAEVEENIARWTGMLVAPQEAKTLEAIPEAPEKPEKEQKPMFETACSICGERTFVPFEPDPSRPVYCKKHLKDARRAQARQSSGKQNFSEQARVATQEKPKPAPIVRPTGEPVSLGEAVNRGPMPFEPRVKKEAPRRERKPVNLDELRKVLEESMKQGDDEGR